MPALCRHCRVNDCAKGLRLCNDCRKLCSKCRAAPKRHDHAYCNDCAAAQTRDRREKRPATPEQRRRYQAASYAAVYLSRGKIERLPCQIDECYAEPTFAFQSNPAKPLEIVWCCRRHLRLMRKKAVSV